MPMETSLQVKGASDGLERRRRISLLCQLESLVDNPTASTAILGRFPSALVGPAGQDRGRREQGCRLRYEAHSDWRRGFL